MQEEDSGIATTESVPSPDESMTAGCGHEAEVSTTVNVTESGAGPEVGTADRKAVAEDAAVVEPAPLTVIVTV
mgnify:CR=1 FL=1